MLPVQTVVFAFAVGLLHSSCAVAGLLVAQLLCKRQTAKANTTVWAGSMVLAGCTFCPTDTTLS